MALLDTIKNIKDFHIDWLSEDDPELDYDQVSITIEQSIKELENYKNLLISLGKTQDLEPGLRPNKNFIKAILIGGLVSLGLISGITIGAMYLISVLCS